jgi:hypothetical protein
MGALIEPAGNRQRKFGPRSSKAFGQKNFGNRRSCVREMPCQYVNGQIVHLRHPVES